MRVEVWNGSGDCILGEGEYNEDVTVHYFVGPDGVLHSRPDAELEPTPEEIEAATEAGWAYFRSPHNPKIVLDDGKVVYGCQVWWKPLEDGEAAKIHYGELRFPEKEPLIQLGDSQRPLEEVGRLITREYGPGTQAYAVNITVPSIVIDGEVQPLDERDVLAIVAITKANGETLIGIFKGESDV